MESGSSQCPVCLGRIPAPHFNSHMTNHSKDEIVAALLRQTTPVTIPQVPGVANTTTATTTQNLNSNGLPQPYPGFHFMATPGDMSSSPFIGKYSNKSVKGNHFSITDRFIFILFSSAHDGYEHGDESHPNSSTKWTSYDHQCSKLRLSSKHAAVNRFYDFNINGQ